MNEQKYNGYTKGKETLELVDTVIKEMNESWRMVNSPLRENPDEVSVLKFAGEGATALNLRNDESIKKALFL